MSVPIAYICVIIIWSTTPLGISWSGDGVGYAFGVALRMTIGLIALLLIIRLMKLDFPMGQKKSSDIFYQWLITVQRDESGVLGGSVHPIRMDSGYIWFITCFYQLLLSSDIRRELIYSLKNYRYVAGADRFSRCIC